MKVLVAAFKQHSGGSHKYHTEDDCSFAPSRGRWVELELLDKQYTECKWCAGEVSKPSGGNTELRDKLLEMDADEI